jgi:hypothetical protein
MLILATKEDMREFSEDPIAMPLALMYKGKVLVSNNMQPISLCVSTVLHEFDDVFLEKVPLGCHHYEQSRTRLIDPWCYFAQPRLLQNQHLRNK